MASSSKAVASSSKAVASSNKAATSNSKAVTLTSNLKRYQNIDQYVQQNGPLMSPWYASAVFYELYPASFQDSNGDGIGDIPGIISRIPYLKKLGVDAVWLAACCKSGGVDRGYDVVDYRDIDECYGTLQDMEKLIQEFRKVGIRLIMDLVVNHTSFEHEWFKESRKSTDNPKRDWYFWRKDKTEVDQDGVVVRSPPNNWRSIFRGSAWTYDEQTDEWYLHCFSSAQPDLNWDNPDVRQAVYEDMRFWLDKGVAGFRMDVINMISKAPGLPDAPVRDPDSPYQNADELYTNGPYIHEYLQEMHQEVVSRYSSTRVAIGETICTSDVETVKLFVTPQRKELSMAYVYDHFTLDAGSGGKFHARKYKYSEFKSFITKWSKSLSFVQNDFEPTGLTQAIWLESHDSGRSVTRFGDRTLENREKVSRMLATLMTTLPGALFVYQGQELGMINLAEDIPISDYPDVETQRTRAEILAKRTKTAEAAQSLCKLTLSADEATADDAEKGTQKIDLAPIDMADIDAEIRIKARDHARAPIPWLPASSSQPHAGFSSAPADKKPWSPMNTDSADFSMITQLRDEDSVLHFWMLAIENRKSMKYSLILSPFEPVEKTLDDGPVFAYFRKNAGFLIVLNLSNQDGVKFTIPRRPRGTYDVVWRELWGTEAPEKPIMKTGDVIELMAYEGTLLSTAW